tara:strand:- start:1054 stop:4110 length:3057 start_codon:yes stop_codon:yes gene_type:complete
MPREEFKQFNFVNRSLKWKFKVNTIWNDGDITISCGNFGYTQKDRAISAIDETSKEPLHLAASSETLTNIKFTNIISNTISGSQTQLGTTILISGDLIIDFDADLIISGVPVRSGVIELSGLANTDVSFGQGIEKPLHSTILNNLTMEASSENPYSQTICGQRTTATFKSLNVSNIDISTNITEIPSTNLKYTSKKHLTVDTRTGANKAKLKSLHIQNDRIENFLALGRDQNDIKIKESDLTLASVITDICFTNTNGSYKNIRVRNKDILDFLPNDNFTPYEQDNMFQVTGPLRLDKFMVEHFVEGEIDKFEKIERIIILRNFKQNKNQMITINIEYSVMSLSGDPNSMPNGVGKQVFFARFNGSEFYDLSLVNKGSDKYIVGRESYNLRNEIWTGKGLENRNNEGLISRFDVSLHINDASQHYNVSSDIENKHRYSNVNYFHYDLDRPYIYYYPEPENSRGMDITLGEITGIESDSDSNSERVAYIPIYISNSTSETVTFVGQITATTATDANNETKIFIRKIDEDSDFKSYRNNPNKQPYFSWLPLVHRINTPVCQWDEVIMSKNGNKIFAINSICGENITVNELWRSMDCGIGWKRLTNQHYIKAITFSEDDNNLYAVSCDTSVTQLLKTDDYGENWVKGGSFTTDICFYDEINLNFTNETLGPDFQVLQNKEVTHSLACSNKGDKIFYGSKNLRGKFLYSNSFKTFISGVNLCCDTYSDTNFFASKFIYRDGHNNNNLLILTQDVSNSYHLTGLDKKNSPLNINQNTEKNMIGVYSLNSHTNPTYPHISNNIIIINNSNDTIDSTTNPIMEHLIDFSISDDHLFVVSNTDQSFQFNQANYQPRNKKNTGIFVSQDKIDNFTINTNISFDNIFSPEDYKNELPNNLLNITSDASLDMQVRHLAISSDNSSNIATTVYFGVNTSSPFQSKKAEPPYGAIFARKGGDVSFKRIGLAPINVNGFGIIRMNQLGDKVVVSERGFSGGRSPNLEHDNINRFQIDSSNNDHGGRIYTTQPF